MQNDPSIQCPNYFCQTLNSVSQQVCSNCQAPLPKRYLWAVGTGLEAYRPGDTIVDRYLLRSQNILLDTKPGFPPDLPSDITPSLEAYLRLFPYRLQVPQVYGYVQTGGDTAILLLEQAPIYPEGARSSQGQALAGTLMPALTSLWASSSALRQLNWLSQLAQLWQPLNSQNAASTLLTPELLRVDGASVRLLELAHSQPATLVQLGHLWAQWQPQANPAIADFLNQVCQNLIDEQIKAPEHLVAVLDQALVNHGKEQRRSVHIATATDQGPSRQTNEDACYPPGGTTLTASTDGQSPLPLVIVCDGIGGHEGGEVASGLAIAAITEQVQTSELIQPTADAVSLIHGLEDAVFAANHVISEQNDVEKRQERQRMGTTVVMGLPHGHELYIAHVGDSRAYRITRTGCYQVTLDDDVASREVRLGYTLYRDALQHAASGSLVQALGMGSSSYLHPTVQRFVLDEDCLFLLCSDGLSDNDRIEECWQTDIVPVLEGRAELATVARKLVDIANTRNGHDNVTVGLMHVRVSTGHHDPIVEVPMTAQAMASTQITAPSSDSVSRSSTSKTQAIDPPTRHWAAPLLTLFGLLGLGVLAFLFIPELRRLFVATSPLPSSPVPTVATPETPASPGVKLTEGSLIQIERGGASPSLALLGPDEALMGDRPPQQTIGQIPSGTILQVIHKQTVQGQTWVRLKVCSVSSSSASAETDAVDARQTGWQQERTIAQFVNPNRSFQPNSNQLGACTPPAPSSPISSPKENLRESPAPNR